MRHLKSAHPFEKIVFKNKKNRSQSASANKRPFSAKQRIPEGITNEKIRESLGNYEEPYSATKDYLYSGEKYGNYKN